MLRKLAIAGMLAAAGTAAFAQANTPGVDQRQVNQERRIEQGERSGALTAREANRLQAGQARVGRKEDRAKSDGVVTARERAPLHHAQAVQSARLARQNHDRHRRPSPPRAADPDPAAPAAGSDLQRIHVELPARRRTQFAQRRQPCTQERVQRAT